MAASNFPFSSFTVCRWRVTGRSSAREINAFALAMPPFGSAVVGIGALDARGQADTAAAPPEACARRRPKGVSQDLSPSVGRLLARPG